MADIHPFQIAVPDSVLADLKERLQRTRWPDHESVDDWSQGLPLACTRELAEYREHEYDWRAREAALGGHFAAFEQPELFGEDIAGVLRRIPLAARQANDCTHDRCSAA